MAAASTRRARLGTGLAAAFVVVLGTSACLPLPPTVVAAPPAPTPAPVPTQPTPPPQPSTPVQPSTPAPTVPADFELPQDDFTNDTGEAYAGQMPILEGGQIPDPPVDEVLEPTRGEPLVESGSPWGADTTADEYLPDVTASADGDLIQSTAGLLLVEDSEGSTFGCSGTVINSSSGDIVITAAHCLYDDSTGGYIVDAQFTPGYHEGDAPFGTWTMDEVWVPEGYQQGFDASLDVGFLRLAPNDGEHIEDAVGGQGVSFTAQTNGAVVVGYPAAPEPYDGEIQRACSDDELDYLDDGDASGVYGFDCVIGGGSSGSGVISNLDPDTGAGTIVSVISSGPDDYTYCPVLSEVAYEGYQQLDQ